MPDLSTLYPQTPTLEGWSAGQVQGQQYLDAQQNQRINQAGALQDLWKKQQMTPLEIEKTRLGNEGLVQDNRHKTTTADKAQYDFDWQKRFENEEYTKKMNEYARLVDADKIAAAKQRISLGLMTAKTPQEQRQYQQALEMTDDIQKELMKIKAQGDQHVRAAEVSAAATRYAADKSAATKKELATNTQQKPPKTLEEQLRFFRDIEQNPDATPEQKQTAVARAEEVKKLILSKGWKSPAMVWGPNGQLVPNDAYGKPGVPDNTPKPGSPENPIVLK